MVGMDAETVDKFFVNLIVEYDSEMGQVSGKKTTAEVYEKTWVTARTKNTGYGEIIACSKFLSALVEVLPMKRYYAHTRLFQPFWLQTNVMGKTGGLMGFVVCQGVELLGELVSKGDFPSVKEIERVIEHRSKANVDKKAHEKEMNAIRDKLEMRDPDYDFWTPELMDAIDNFAVDHFKDIRDIIGIREPEYVSALADYTKEVIKIVQEYHPEHEMLSKVIARFKFVMNDTTTLPIALPLITDFVFEAVALSFNSTPYAINTISHWFEPFIGYPLNARGSRRWSDPSNVMWTTIQQDPTIDDNDQAAHDVFNFILAARGTYIPELEAHLYPLRDRLNREANVAELDKFFAPESPDSDDWRDAFLPSNKLKDVNFLISAMNKKFSNALSKHDLAQAQKMLGWQLMLRSAIDWTRRMPGVHFRTRKFNRLVFAKAAMVEHKRARLLKRIVTNTTIAHFRQGFLDIMSNYTLGRTQQDGTIIYDWGFPDGIDPDSEAPRLTNISVFERLALVRASEEEYTDPEAIKSLFKNISKLAAAKLDTSPDAPLEENVARALKALKLALVFNARRLRHVAEFPGTRFNPEDATLTGDWDIPIGESKPAPNYDFTLGHDGREHAGNNDAHVSPVGEPSLESHESLPKHRSSSRAKALGEPKQTRADSRNAGKDDARASGPSKKRSRAHTARSSSPENRKKFRDQMVSEGLEGVKEESVKEEGVKEEDVLVKEEDVKEEDVLVKEEGDTV